MKFKKLGLVVASGFMLSSLLVACGKGASETTQVSVSPESKTESKVKITFWDDNAGPQRTPHYEELIKRFNKAYPNIEVEYVGLPIATAKQKFDVAISANDMPDVGGVQQTWISDFAAKGALLPLDDYFAKWSESSKISATVIQGSRDAVPDKKLYQLPNTSNYGILWYRADWFKAANVNVPQTWDEFFSAVEKFTDTGKNQYGFTIRGGGGSIRQLTDMLYAHSGISEYFTTDGKATINTPANVEFLKKYIAVYKNFTPVSDITNGYKEMVANFDSGIAAMVQHNLGSYGEHTKAFGEKSDKFAAMPYPKAINGKRVMLGGENNGYGIFKTSKNPDAAFKFVSFLTSAESQIYWNQNIGQLPTNSDSLKSDWVKNTQHIQVLSSAISEKDTSVLVPPVYLPDYASILLQVLEPGFQKVLAGKYSVEDFLNEWAEEMEKAQAEYVKSVKK